MHKTPMKHRNSARKRIKHYLKSPKNDVDKIKAFLRETTQHFRHSAGNKLNQSIENVKEKSEELQDYLGERPIKSVGVS